MKSSISPQFVAKKRRILNALAIPDTDYTDLSPKGSVDEGIRDLIDEINSMDGMVTTSSCAGRVSVFLEGSKLQESIETRDVPPSTEKKSVPGGKGMGGRWLYVSHEPVDCSALLAGGSLHGLFGLEPSSAFVLQDTAEQRLVRMQFEPMILHIMTATLSHAQRLLAAALNAGFRESGVQSLKAIQEDTACTMVAVRTAGLALSSVIGVASATDASYPARSIVSEEYLKIMLSLANERFVANAERIGRFRQALRDSCTEWRLGAGTQGNKREWESKCVRAERMRREGLAKQKLMNVLRRSDKADVPDILDSSASLDIEF